MVLSVGPSIHGAVPEEGEGLFCGSIGHPSSDDQKSFLGSEFGRLWLLERLKSEFFMNPYTRFVAAWICSVDRQENPSLMIF